MTGLMESLKRLVSGGSGSRGDDGDGGRRRQDPPSGSRDKELDKLPPERAAELAGHAPERVET
jgi:hypothetical protein